jgi:hypothetical protein
MLYYDATDFNVTAKINTEICLILFLLPDRAYAFRNVPGSSPHLALNQSLLPVGW